MTLRTALKRVSVLLGVVWVQFVLAGPGLHDPNCTHHGAGVRGMVHVDRAGAAHEGMGGHAVHGAPGTNADADAAKGSTDPSSNDCHCLGVCIPGPSVGPTTVARADLDPIASPTDVQVEPARARTLDGLSLVHPLLPPSTGPPATA